MWYLIENDPQDGPQLRYWLGGVKSDNILIGRKNVHVRIKQASVSRTHATLRVVESTHYSLSQRSGPNKHVRSTAVKIEDSSAYGTYVKYPASDADGGEMGHHMRLGKHTPTEIKEGAHIAFGAPNSWWRLAWHDVLCFMPDYQSSAVTDMARSMACAGGIEVAKTFSSEVTHVIVEQARSDCMAIITALVSGTHLVTPAWLSSVQHTADGACKLITEAANNEAAIAATRLANESQFAPKFSDDDEKKYGAEILGKVFATPARSRRSLIFKDRAFAFANKDALSKWSLVLERMGAKTLDADVVRKGNRAGVIVIEEDTTSLKRKRSRKSTVLQNKGKVTELALIASILSGDESYVIQKGTENISNEFDDMDQESTRRRKMSKGNVKRKSEDSQSTKKVVAINQTSDDCLYESADILDTEDLNERVSMNMNPLNMATKTMTETTLRDVRPFRRRNLPNRRTVPLKKALYTDEDQEFSSREPERKHRNTKLRSIE